MLGLTGTQDACWGGEGRSGGSYHEHGIEDRVCGLELVAHKPEIFFEAVEAAVPKVGATTVRIHLFSFYGALHLPVQVIEKVDAEYHRQDMPVDQTKCLFLFHRVDAGSIWLRFGLNGFIVMTNRMAPRLQCRGCHLGLRDRQIEPQGRKQIGLLF